MAGHDYRSVAKLGKSELVIKGSRFIGQAFPVESAEEAEEKIAAIRDLYSDATHNCFAYRVGTGPGATYRFSDDGEPAGTAGRPILQAIEGKGLTNVAVVVTRYFGGTKLGAGGLVRAYSRAAATALEEAQPVEKSAEVQLQLIVSYAFLNAVRQAIEATGGRVIRSRFADQVALTVVVPEGSRNELVARVREVTAGKVVVAD